MLFGGKIAVTRKQQILLFSFSVKNNGKSVLNKG